MKTFFKELFIYIFLTALIALILSVMFYEDIPINKTVPTQVEYQLPEMLQEELDKTLTEEKPPEITYKVDNQRMEDYEDNESYVPGKIDPFAVVSDTTTGGTPDSSGGNTTGTTGNNTGNATSNSGSNTTNNSSSTNK